MAKSTTTSPDIKLSAGAIDNGTPIPVLSFGAVKFASDTLTSEEFDIDNPSLNVAGAGQKLIFTGYYDASHKLVFALDKTMDERTPNILLVMNPDADNPDRKWDDILENDYNLNVNDIRPKKDNKYQKLDIEYSGLSVYNNVINAYKSGGDLPDALVNLSIFRDSVARKTAGERLIAAEHKIMAATGTIKQTSESIQKLRDRLIALREKLSKQKKSVGKEPTKESAAKILKTEAQIDDIKEKIKRANKRLRRAESRLAASRDDADDAKKRLGMPVIGIAQNTDPAPKGRGRSKISESKRPDGPVFKATAFSEWRDDNEQDEPKVENMADQNVTPLFDKDPDIMNEEIAFKPITFDMPSARPEPQSAPEFEPPVYTAPEPVRQPEPTPAPTTPREPIFGTIPVPSIAPEPMPTAQTPTPFSGDDYIPNIAPANTVSAPLGVIRPEPEPSPEPIRPMGDAVPMPPAPVAPPTHPTFPDGGPAIPTIAPDRKKTSRIYYLLLILLIALSIFTLWLYQRRTSSDTAPAITEPVAAPSAPVSADVPENPFLVTEPMPAKAQPAPVSQPGEQPTPATGYIETPMYQPTEDAAPYIPTEEEILGAKPAYNIPDSELPGAVYDQPVPSAAEETEYEMIDPNTETIVVSGQVINDPTQPVDGVYYNYERGEFERITPGDNRPITPGVNTGDLGEPDEFVETYDAYESYEEYEENAEVNDPYYYY